MPIRYVERRAGEVVVVENEGGFDLPTILGAMTTLERRLEGSPQLLVVDLRHSTSTFSYEEARQLVAHCRTLQGLASSEVVFLAPRPVMYGMSRMLAAVAESAELEVHVLRTERELLATREVEPLPGRDAWREEGETLVP